MMDNNIHHMRTEPPLLAPIFRSEGQAQLLSELFLSSAPASLTDLAKRTGLAYATVHREVARLLEAGILKEQQVGRTRLIAPDSTSPLHEPLRNIMVVATGPVPLLAGELADIPGVEAALLYGSFAARSRGVAGPPPQDIDVMVVGTPDPEHIYDACERVGDRVDRPVNPVIVTWEELRQDSGFHQQVRSSPFIPIVGASPWS